MEQTNKQLSFPILLIWREEAEQGCCVCASKGREGGRGEWELLARRQQLCSSANVWPRINIGSQAALVVLLPLLLLFLLLPPPYPPLPQISFSNFFQCHHLTWRTFLSRPVFWESILSSLESGFWLIWKWPFMMRSWWCLNEVRARFVFA